MLLDLVPPLFRARLYLKFAEISQLTVSYYELHSLYDIDHSPVRMRLYLLCTD